MAKKVYILEHLDCANCGAKIEEKLRKLPEVEDATVTFATRQLAVTAEDPDGLLPKLEALARSVEPEVVIRPREAGHHSDHHEAHEHCDCHDHHEEHGHCDCHDHHEEHGHCSCHDHHEEGHKHSHHHGGEGEEPLWPLLLGAGLFVLALVTGSVKLLSVGAFLAAYLVLSLPILKKAAKGLLHGLVLDENFLMGIASLGAMAMGEFSEAVGIMLFYRIGEFFEEKAVARSRSRIMEAVDLRPETVNRLHGSDVETIPASDARVGDVLLVRPGERIPLDGTVLTGESRVDTAPINGEPVPLSVRPGEAVVSGCVNLSGQLTIRAEKPLEESMVTRILNSVENAAANKPQVERFITRFARVYTPAVVGIAVLTAVVPSLFTGNWGYWVYTALSFLVMSCPCALVLSVPLAFFSGIGLGGKQGILFKGGAAMEAMSGIRAVAMDKTGTLTEGVFALREQEGGEAVLALCAACEQASTHPIAVSVLAAARERGLTLAKPQSVEELPGRGLRAVVDGVTVLCGSEALLRDFGTDMEDFAPSTAGTQVLVAADGKYLGRLTLADRAKPKAAEAVAELKAMGVAAAMLTGDAAGSAGEMARELGIGEVYARLLPEEKLTRLEEIRAAHGRVMFVGDGINDAPVLAGADVGAAMGSGADAAMEAADVVFMTADPSAIPQSLRLAKRTRRIAWQNVVFALAVKLVVMLLGLFGHASMWMAVFADSGVAMLCVLNSLRLLYGKKS